MTKRPFSEQIAQWHAEHGRKNLPWQQGVNAYRIWVSEIMLQQTQVATVIPYYEKFMARFPDIATLAVADEDAVLQHWAGLGYYARARNLHHAAQTVVHEHDGVFPTTLAALQALSGIGRSTAGAILAFSEQQIQPILDGNVKRVLARYAGIAGHPSEKAVAAALWSLAEQLLPPDPTQIVAYTQGMMDLGSLVCKRSSPQCKYCPVQAQCVANAQQKTDCYPGKKTTTINHKPKKTEQKMYFVCLISEGDLFLQKRPSKGIWGGLWAPPVFDDTKAQQAAIRQWTQNEQYLLNRYPLPDFTHDLTHLRLKITTTVCQLSRRPDELVFSTPAQYAQYGLPKPIQQMVAQLRDSSHGDR